jgi:hypothetical protein
VSLHVPNDVSQFPNVFPRAPRIHPTSHICQILTIVTLQLPHELYYFQKCWNFQIYFLFFWKEQHFVKENIGSSGIFYLLKWKFSNFS